MHGRAKGYIGEQLAAEYLEAKGLRIIARNKKFAGVEVDILACDGNTLVLCEVKTAEQANAHPSMWVSREQQRRYVRAATSLLMRRAYSGCNVRFDVIEVCAGSVRVIEGAFEA